MFHDLHERYLVVFIREHLNIPRDLLPIDGPLYRVQGMNEISVYGLYYFTLLSSD